MRVAGAQGGFLVVRPSRAVFSDLVEVVREGRFGGRYSGWNNSGIGNWCGGRRATLQGLSRRRRDARREPNPRAPRRWGGATVQGAVPYYYSIVAP